MTQYFNSRLIHFIGIMLKSSKQSNSTKTITSCGESESNVL